MKAQDKSKDKEKDKNKETLRNLPAIIALIAALVVSIVMLVNKKNSLDALIAVLCFLVGFYIVGQIFRSILIAVATKEPEKTEEQDSKTEEKENLESDTK